MPSNVTKPTSAVKVLAFYLPQFHPIPENDEWWGKGFTEWTNVAKAQPLFRSHYQPHVPADLGFYDLRVPETRQAQADLAAQYGVSGFCYWHYWFGDGRRILERPFDEVVRSGAPDFPFCLAWANQSWTGIWHGLTNRILIDQRYPGTHDHERHFYTMLPAFMDRRYLRIDGRLVFVIYAPGELPNPASFLKLWTKLAQREGIDGFYFVAHGRDMRGVGFDAFIRNLPFTSMPPVGFVGHSLRLTDAVLRRTLGMPLSDIGLAPGPRVKRYAHFVEYFENKSLGSHELPLLIPNWDNTPRSGQRGIVLQGSTPELFERLCKAAYEKLRDAAQKVVFLKAWNEWAEGNHVEPDLRHGHGFLEALQRGLRL